MLQWLARHERILNWADAQDSEDDTCCLQPPRQPPHNDLPRHLVNWFATPLTVTLRKSVDVAETMVLQTRERQSHVAAAALSFAANISRMALGPGIVPKVRLFGSFEYLMNTGESDVDIMVDLPPNTKQVEVFLTDCVELVDKYRKEIVDIEVAAASVIVMPRHVTAVCGSAIPYKKTFCFKLNGLAVDFTAQLVHMKDGVQLDKGPLRMTQFMKAAVQTLPQHERLGGRIRSASSPVCMGLSHAHWSRCCNHTQITSIDKFSCRKA